VTALSSQGAVVVYVVPPVYGPTYQQNAGSYQLWLKTVLASIPQAPVINLNAPDYAAVTSDPDNYVDPVHLQPHGAAEVADLLIKFVPEALASAK
jgi:hypothetical protein